jgi:hypothetical protein
MSLLAALVLVQAFPPRPAIVSREEWGAKPVLATAKRHTISRITVHHGGVPANPDRTLQDKLRGLQAWSQRDDKLASGKTKPAWPDIPYHFYIDVKGEIGEARPVQFAGDTNTEYNPTGHLLIVLEGDFDKAQVPDVQWESLKKLALWTAWSWKVPAIRIEGHDDHSSQTSCPGANLKPRLPELRVWVGDRLARIGG